MEQIKKSMNELEDFAEDIVRQFLVFPIRVKHFKEKFEKGFNHNSVPEIGLFARNTLASTHHRTKYKGISSVHVKVLNKLILYTLCNKLNYPNGSFKVTYKEANEAFGMPKVKPIVSDEMLGMPESYKSIGLVLPKQIFGERLVDADFGSLEDILFASIAKRANMPASRLFGTQPSISLAQAENYYELMGKVGSCSNLCQEVTLDTLTKREKPMQNLSIYRPVLVGNVDILKASDDTLVQIIRDAKAQIENNLDLAKLTKKFQVKNKELQDVIDLCVAQLDK